MGRFFIVAGILTIFAGAAFMMAMFGLFGDNIVEQILVPIACDSGDSLRLERTNYSLPGETRQSIEYFCVDNEGIEEDISGQAVMVTVAGFVVALLTGILMTIMGAVRAIRAQTQAFTQIFAEQTGGSLQSSVIDLRGNTTRRGQIPPQTQAILQQVFSQMGDAMGTNNTLADRLQQLEDARKQGLISQTEYERVRQAILDSMDD